MTTTTAPFETEIRTLLSLAAERGLREVEIYAQKGAGVSVRAQAGGVESFTRSDAVGLGLRVIEGERVGYAYTERLGADALAQALDRAAANARLVEPEPGAALPEPQAAPETRALAWHEQALLDAPVADKIEAAKRIEAAAKAADPRIRTVPGAAYGDGESIVRIASTKGLDRVFASTHAAVHCYPVASADGENKTYTESQHARGFAALDPTAVAETAAHAAARRLGAKEIASGTYTVVLAPRAMAELLGTFTGMFSARAALEGKSLLVGKLGERIGSPAVTLIDDPLHPEGMGSRPFDAEGVPSRALTLIEAGVFKTFLHNTQTARQLGAASTGHAARGSYKGTVGIAPSNLYLLPGAKAPGALLASDAPEAPVLLIDDLQGLHAGTNPISGDFSLAAQGYLYENGELAHPAHNFTVAGNILQLLADVAAVGNDLTFFGDLGTPSVRVSRLSIAGR